MFAASEGSVERALLVHNLVEEFDKWTEQNFEERLSSPTAAPVVLIASTTQNCAEEGPQDVGYTVGYDRYKDGSYYCWMAGVANGYRRHGVLTLLMSKLEEWAKAKGYKALRIKTRNNRREMLGFLVKKGWDFIDIEKHPSVSDHRLVLQKMISS
ncbi:GNAT family N-acetyltransferase [Balamuthia mandrillaris]